MCVLRASGVEFDPYAFLKRSTLEPCHIFRRGEPRPPRSQRGGASHTTSGVNFVVSNASRSDLPAQVADAERFLGAHRAELERLSQAPGVTNLTLDFPIRLRIDGTSVFAQYDLFPASLVRLAGALGIALELSTYPPSGE